MKTTNSHDLLGPPSLLKTIVAGFDIITNNIYLILFPIGLDLLVWFSPRLRLMSLIESLVGDLMDRSLDIAPDLEATEMINSAQELWHLAGENINLIAALRSYPVGIPSLMTSILPLDNPLGTPDLIEVNSFGSVLSYFLILSFLGLILGTLFFSSVAKVAVSDSIDWQQIVKDWPWLSIQVILLTLIWFFLLLGISIPASFIISLATLGSIAFGQCVVLLYGGLLIWIIFPLLFSAHGIFINQNKVWPSIKHGILITRMTLPLTSLFFVGVFLLTQGLDFLWRVPPENSWLMLLSVAGHAFVTTSLLSASFIYYNDADKWIRNLQSQDPTEKKLESIP